jgi:hypothetical protein
VAIPLDRTSRGRFNSYSTLHEGKFSIPRDMEML